MRSRSSAIRRSALASAFMLATLLTACGGADDAATDTSAVTVPPATPAAGAATLTDAQIAHVAVTANSIDSAAGVMAGQMATSQAVKDYAETMVRDHGGLNREAEALATRLNLTPADNDVSRGLKTSADSTMATLHSQSGAAYDRAYIANEVAFHQTVLDALDNTLIPGAQNAELKALLEKARPAVAAHLTRAQSVQSNLQ